MPYLVVQGHQVFQCHGDKGARPQNCQGGLFLLIVSNFPVGHCPAHTHDTVRAGWGLWQRQIRNIRGVPLG